VSSASGNFFPRAIAAASEHPVMNTRRGELKAVATACDICK
jgi:hypothetical protein